MSTSNTQLDSESVQVETACRNWVTIFAFLAGFVLTAFIVVWLVLHQKAMNRLPRDIFQLPVSSYEEMAEIPPRPGVQGITIMGSIEKPLVFTIDEAHSTPLDWEELMQIAPKTDVKVFGRINEFGKLRLLRIDGEGYASAVRLIRNALSTWNYTDYKSGDISFWFNLPSYRYKLQINTLGLITRNDLPADKVVHNGKLFLIEGIPGSVVKPGIAF